MRGVGVAVLATAINLAVLAATVARGDTRSPPPDPVLRGRALELIDEGGTMRARLNVEPGGAVVLRLMDAEGTIRVKLGADREGSGLLLANEATEPGIHLLAGKTGSRIRVVNRDGRERLVAP
jgi:hypothetical protein